MNHKRGRPKNRRAGCLLCKPHKATGVDRPRRQELRARQDERDSAAPNCPTRGCVLPAGHEGPCRVLPPAKRPDGDRQERHG